MTVFADRRREHTAQVATVKKVDPVKYWSVSAPGKGYKSYDVSGQVSGGDQRGYVAVKDNKESVDVGGLIGLPGSRGVAKSALAKVDRLYPESPQTLDAFDEKSRGSNVNLPTLYAKHGFKETGRAPFDPQYAPPEWNEAEHGRPDVVFMSRPAAQGSLFPDQFPTTPQHRTPAPPTLQKKQFTGGTQMSLPGV